MKHIEEVMDDPIDDTEMKSYLGQDAKIMKYSNLKQFDNIHELLPEATDFVVLLYQSKPQEGHWVAVLKYANNLKTVIEYFDPYGNTIDEPLRWISEGENRRMGISAPFLSNILSRTSNEKLLENTIKYQTENPKIETCGRHVIYRILQMVQRGMTQSQYNAHMRNLKNRNPKKSYDEIVSSIISM